MSRDPRIARHAAFIESEVRSRFPARWDASAPAICADIENEVDRALGEALRATAAERQRVVSLREKENEAVRDYQMECHLRDLERNPFG